MCVGVQICCHRLASPGNYVTHKLKFDLTLPYGRLVWGKFFFFRCHSHLEGRVKQIWESSASEIAAGGEFRLDFCFCIEPQLKLQNRFSGGKFDENFFLNEPSQSAWACQEPLGWKIGFGTL